MILHAAAAVWGLALLLSFAGWGALVNRALFPGARVDIGQGIAWGMAFCVACGGLLNLFGLIRGTLLFVLVILGLCGLLGTRSADPGRSGVRPRTIKEGFGFVCAVLLFAVALRYLDSVFRHGLNDHDDLQAYVNFPYKMLATGSLGADPFSENRIKSSLGGQAFLHTFLLCPLPEGFLGMLDGGVAFLGALLATKGMADRVRLPSGAALIVLGFLSLLIPSRNNISSEMGGLLLLVSLFRTLDWRGLAPETPVRNGAIVALVAACLCSLKSTLIPGTAVILLVSYLSLLASSTSRARALVEASAVVGFMVVLLAPWMISLHRSSGTFLFPVLGLGYHGARYGSFRIYEDPTNLVRRLGVVGTSASILLPMVLGVTALASRGGEGPGPGAPRRRPLLALLLGSCVATLIMVVAFSEYDALRYPFPFCGALTLASAVVLLEWLGRGDAIAGLFRDPPVFVRGLILFVSLGMILGEDWRRARGMYAGGLAGIVRGARGPLADRGAWVRQHRAMQESVPPGVPILAKLSRPFLLDFSRNPVYVVDAPGGSSPPPGLPLSDAESLARYLLGQRVRYVAYSHGDEANLSENYLFKTLGWPRPDPNRNDRNTWSTTFVLHSLKFNALLRGLMQTRRIVYRDDLLVLIDLAEAAGRRAGIGDRPG